MVQTPDPTALPVGGRTTRQVSGVMPIRVVPVAPDGGDPDTNVSLPVYDQPQVSATIDMGQTLLETRDLLRAILTVLCVAYQLDESPEGYLAMAREDRAA